jgi:chemotaxis family two-component system sensor kinase Cph1
MEALINSLLTYARVGPKTKNLKLINCNDIIHRATVNLQREIERTGAVITSDELPTLWADDIQFSQLFQNLIGNGIKFCRETYPSVHISASQTKTEWIFTVRDNGVGIDPKDMSRIFEMFQRLQNSSEYQGHGIGLAICKKIVENHGGRIWVNSEPGKGSTFHFSIPTVTPPTTGQE